MARGADASDVDETRPTRGTNTHAKPVDGSADGHALSKVVQGGDVPYKGFDADNSEHGPCLGSDTEPRIGPLLFLRGRELVHRRRPVLAKIDDAWSAAGRELVVLPVLGGRPAAYLVEEVPVDLRRVTRLEVEVTQIVGRHADGLHVGPLGESVPTVLGGYCVFFAIRRHIIQWG